MQANRTASTSARDLGGEALLKCYIFLRRVWWQNAPRVEQLYASHPMLRLDFFEEHRLNGTWDRWAAVVRQYHAEVQAMQRALDVPIGAIATSMAPELLVARLLEPVHVSGTLELWSCLLHSAMPDLRGCCKNLRP